MRAPPGYARVGAHVRSFAEFGPQWHTTEGSDLQHSCSDSCPLQLGWRTTHTTDLDLDLPAFGADISEEASRNFHELHRRTSVCTLSLRDGESCRVVGSRLDPIYMNVSEIDLLLSFIAVDIVDALCSMPCAGDQLLGALHVHTTYIPRIAPGSRLKRHMTAERIDMAKADANSEIAALPAQSHSVAATVRAGYRGSLQWRRRAALSVSRRRDPHAVGEALR